MKKLIHKINFKGTTIAFLFFLIIILTSIQVSALDIGFNQKTFNKDIGKYGMVTIEDWFGLGDPITTLEEKDNSDVCGIDCFTDIEIIMFENGVLIDDVRHMRLQTDGSWSKGRVRNPRFYIINGNKKTSYELGEEVSVGTYYVRHEAEKNPKHTIDWQIKSQGKWIDEWDVWAEGDFIDSWITDSTSPNDVTVYENNLWVAEFDDKVIAKYDREGNFISKFLTNLSNAAIDGVTTNGTFIWTSDQSYNHLFKYDMDGNYILSTKLEATNTESRGISNNGSVIFVTDTNDDVYNYEMNGDFIKKIDSGTANRFGVATYETFLYLSDSADDNVLRNYTNMSSRGIGNFDLNASNSDPLGMTTDGSFLWVVDNLDDRVYKYYSGLADVKVLLGVPSDNSFSINPSVLFNATIIPGQNFNITNSTIKVYNSKGTLLNETTKIITGNAENTTNFSISNLNPENLIWNIESCVDDLTEVTYTFADNNRTLNYGIVINSQNFSNTTTEGATEFFAINFTKFSTVQVSTVNLVYNGSKNSFAYVNNGNETISQGNVVIPTQTTKTSAFFYWNIIFNDGNQINTTSINQTILIINIDDCSSFSNLIYNFSQLDEELKTPLTTNNTMEIQINLYDTSKTQNLVNFSEKFVDTNPAQICLESPVLTNVNYSSYVIVKYSANSTGTTETYTTEYYNILNQTITNTTIPINISLYDLKEDDATKFRLTFRDSSYVLAPNILVQVHRQYVEDNDFKVVEIPLTDNNGQTMLNLVRNDIVYNFIMINEAGEVIATFNSMVAFCQDFTIGECTIILAAESIGEDAYDYDEEFGISVTSPTYDNSTERISITFITDDLKPKTVLMDVFRNNAFGNRSVCSNSLTSASGDLSCNVSSVTSTDQFLFIHVFVDGELFTQYTINLNASTLNFGTINGAFYAFLIILFLICLFMEDKKVLLISLGIGWVIIISLGLMNGKLIGATSAGIWILVSITIFIWKLNKDESI